MLVFSCIMVKRKVRVCFSPLGPLEELEIHLELCNTLPKRKGIQMFGRSTRSKYAVPKKTPKKTTSGKGHKPTGSCLMPGYTGHVPGMMSMDAGLSYMQKTGQMLDKAERPDRMRHTVQIAEPLDIVSNELINKELKKSKSQKSKSTFTKGQKLQPSTKHKSKEQKVSNSQQHGVHRDAPAGKSPSLKPPAASQHMSPVSGYTGHIPGQLTTWPGMHFSQHVAVAQNGLWNPNESVLNPAPSNHNASCMKKPSGYTGHLPGAIHLEPGLTYRKVTKAIQNHMSPAETPSKPLTGENSRGKGKSSVQVDHSDFYNTVPSGYCGHIPGMMLLEPGQTYSMQNARLFGTNKKHSQKPAVPQHSNSSGHWPYPSGYCGHIPGAHLLEPGLSYTQQTKILEERLKGDAVHKTKSASSRPPSKPSSKASSVRSQASKQSVRSNLSSKASTREPTPSAVENKSKSTKGKPNGVVYTSKGNVPGYTGHVPSTSDYHGLTYGDMTKDFGKSHQSKEPDELVKDLRVRMPW